MSRVTETSIKAYEQLKSSETIRDRQALAYTTVLLFYREYKYWPTQREAHVFLLRECDLLTQQQRSEAITDGYRYIGRRMGELVESENNDFPDMLEKIQPRTHKYLAENYPGADSGRQADPHRIKAYTTDNADSTPSLEWWGVGFK